MNYYPHHIGDYAKDAGHISFFEDAAYRRMLDRYYGTEQPLPNDLGAICRVTRAHSEEERNAVAIVLREFFTLEEDGWHQPRCDQEISKYSKRRPEAAAKAAAHRERQRRYRERLKQNGAGIASHGIDGTPIASHDFLRDVTHHVTSQCASVTLVEPKPITNIKEKDRVKEYYAPERCAQPFNPEPVFSENDAQDNVQADLVTPTTHPSESQSRSISKSESTSTATATANPTAAESVVVVVPQHTSAPVASPVAIAAVEDATPTLSHPPEPNAAQNTLSGAKSAKPPRPQPAAIPQLDNLDPQLLADWRVHRKEKRAPITLTAVRIFEREAAKVSAAIKQPFTLEDAILFSIENGWAGFTAPWYFKRMKQENVQQSRGSTRYEESMRRASILTGHDPRQDNHDSRPIIDITNEGAYQDVGISYLNPAIANPRTMGDAPF